MDAVAREYRERCVWMDAAGEPSCAWTPGMGAGRGFAFLRHRVGSRATSVPA